MLALALALIAGNTDLIERCASAAEKAEPLKRAGRFTEALELLKVCSADACPKVVKEQCRILRADAATQVPTCVVTVQDESHAEVSGVAVLLDGARLGSLGEPLEMNPGVHAFDFSAEGFAPQHVEVVVRAAEKLRPVVVTLLKPSVEVEARPARSIVPPLVVTGLTVAGYAVFTVLGLSVRHEVDVLNAECAPGCSREQVSAERLKAGIADGTLLLSLILTGITTWLWIRFASG